MSSQPTEETVMPESMPEPMLSLCVPTYNRAGFLRGTLDRVASQVSCLAASSAGTVEVVVSDNASTDGTAEVV